MLVLASGRSTRFGGDTPKVFVDCGGRSLLLHGLRRLARVTAEREIIVAVQPEDRARFVAPCMAELKAVGVDRLVDGGATRQQSMRNALAATNPDHPLVLVHDAARPFPPIEATRQALQRAAAVGAAVLAIRVPDTLKRVDAAGRVAETVDRSAIWQAQTPQVMQRDLLWQALAAADRDGFDGTDDVSLLEHAGLPVEVVPGHPANIKVTTRQDLELARLLAGREDGA